MRIETPEEATQILKNRTKILQPYEESLDEETFLVERGDINVIVQVVKHEGHPNDGYLVVAVYKDEELVAELAIVAELLEGTTMKKALPALYNVEVATADSYGGEGVRGGLTFRMTPREW